MFLSSVFGVVNRLLQLQVFLTLLGSFILGLDLFSFDQSISTFDLLSAGSPCVTPHYLYFRIVLLLCSAVPMWPVQLVTVPVGSYGRLLVLAGVML